MTNEANRLICERLAGYEVQVSPAGKHFIVTDEGTKPLVDYESDWAEAMTTMIALCRSRGWTWEMSNGDVRVWQYRNTVGPTLSCLAHCLLQIAEGEE